MITTVLQSIRPQVEGIDMKGFGSRTTRLSVISDQHRVHYIPKNMMMALFSIGKRGWGIQDQVNSFDGSFQGQIAVNESLFSYISEYFL